MPPHLLRNQAVRERFTRHFLDLYPPPFDSTTIAILFVRLVFLLLSFVYGVLKIPSLVNSIFAGRSGEVAPPRAID